MIFIDNFVRAITSNGPYFRTDGLEEPFENEYAEYEDSDHGCFKVRAENVHGCVYFITKGMEHVRIMGWVDTNTRRARFYFPRANHNLSTLFKRELGIPDDGEVLANVYYEVGY